MDLETSSAVAVRDGTKSDRAATVADDVESTVSSRDLEQVLAMSLGKGTDSYSENSTLQSFTVQKFVLPHLADALDKIDLPDEGPVVVADLGCSSGPNTIDHLGFIMEKLRARYAAAEAPFPEFQAFFCDLPTNDFNNLFKFLNSDPRTSSHSAPDLLLAGVPGSFYGRLFPRASVHVFFSFHALHWLSKVPNAATDKKSPAFNKGKLWVNTCRPEVVAVYRAQALTDLKNFLCARAAELVPGGLLFLLFNGRLSPSASNLSEQFLSRRGWRYMEDIWRDLVAEGLLTEEQGDAFNFPIYRRTYEEVMEAVESCKSSFHVVSAELHGMKSSLVEVWPTATPTKIASNVAGAYKSLFNGFLEEEVGKEIADIFWQRYEQKMVKQAVLRVLVRPEPREKHRHIVVLIRK